MTSTAHLRIAPGARLMPPPIRLHPMPLPLTERGNPATYAESPSQPSPAGFHPPGQRGTLFRPEDVRACFDADVPAETAHKLVQRKTRSGCFADLRTGGNMPKPRARGRGPAIAILFAAAVLSVTVAALAAKGIANTAHERVNPAHFCGAC